MINNQNIEEAKKMVKGEQRPIIVLAQNDEFNRKLAEQAKFDILLSIENGIRKNKIRQTDSGLNEVLAKIMSKKEIALGINLSEIKKLEPKAKGERLAKIKQNIRISRKCNVKMAVKAESLAEARDLLGSLGSSTKQSKEAIVF